MAESTGDWKYPSKVKSPDNAKSTVWKSGAFRISEDKEDTYAYCMWCQRDGRQYRCEYQVVFFFLL